MKANRLWIVNEDRAAEKSPPQLFAIVIATLIAMFSVVHVIAQEPEDDNSVVSPRSDAISGRVVSVNGQPLANAVVSVRALDSLGQGSMTTTDSEGNFRMSGLESKAYAVSASAPGYTTAPRDPASSQPNIYRVGDTVRLELWKGGVITGTVTTSAGEPVVAIQVHAYMIRDANGQPPRYGSQPRHRMTDDRGIYRLYGLPPGTYVLAAGGAGSLSSSHFSSAYETDTPTYAPSSVRKTAREIIVRSGEETTNVDIRYRGEPGFTISGKASDSRSPAEFAWFNIILSSLNSGDLQENMSSYQTVTGQGFALYGIADGDYLITGQSYYSDQWAVSESQRIRVRGADVTGIELITKPFGSIAGRVALEESKAPECKNKRRPVLAETVITPWHNEKENKNQPLFLWSVGGPSTPNKDGAFTLRNLVSGQYRLNMRFSARYWYLRSMTSPPSIRSPDKTTLSDRSQDVTKNWITVKLGDRITGVVLTLAEGAASFHGQVKIPDAQKPASRLSVFMVPAESENAEDVLRFFASMVSTDGSFALNNLPPGRYWVNARAAPENEFDPQLKLRLPDQSAERAKLRQEVEAARTAIELKPCQNVTNYSLLITGQ